MQDEATEPQAFALTASPGYLDTFGIELLQGRFFAPSDRFGRTPVVVVNRSFAERWFAGESALGHRIEFRDEAREIVGIVQDVQQVMIQTPGGVQSEAIYMPAAQAPADGYFVTLRTRAGDPRLLAGPLESALQELDPDLTVTQVLTMPEVTEQAFVGIDVFNTILGSFGVLAILLASIGSYGVLAYSVNQRRNEIGIRMALGAEGRNVVWMVARQGLSLSVLGLGIGGLLLVPLLGVIRSLMVGIAPVRGNTTVSVAALLFAVTAVASLVPACRAARLKPGNALNPD
jgi:ABC-type antimicrobial peptide transport system permease subunit